MTPCPRCHGLTLRKGPQYQVRMGNESRPILPLGTVTEYRPDGSIARYHPPNCLCTWVGHRTATETRLRDAWGARRG